MLIVNKFGLFHEVPDGLLATVQRQGGRVATKEEAKAFESGALRVGEKSAPVAQPPAPTAALPFPDYDSLSVAQVLARCVNLSAEGKTAVLAYELSAKQRKGILEGLSGE